MRTSKAKLPILTLLWAVVLLMAPSWAEGVVAPPSLLQKLRALLGLNQRIATGGSRGGINAEVCWISPQVERQATGEASGLVVLASPTLVFQNKLNEVQIERDNRLAWQKLASSSQPIIGPIPWPLAPIQADETVTLRLRPQGASGADFANITLKGAPAKTLEANSVLVKSLDTKPEVWLSGINQQLDQTRSSLALALLFSPEAPNVVVLNDLRRQLTVRGCGDKKE
jgi:hypothetical protein